MGPVQYKFHYLWMRDKAVSVLTARSHGAMGSQVFSSTCLSPVPRWHCAMQLANSFESNEGFFVDPVLLENNMMQPYGSCFIGLGPGALSHLHLTYICTDPCDPCLNLLRSLTFVEQFQENIQEKGCRRNQ